MKRIIRYPHGWNKGGVFDNDYSPALTTSSWVANNLLLEIYETEGRSNIQGLLNTTRGGCYLSQTQRFFKGHLKDLSRCVTTNAGDVGVCVEQFNEKDMGKIYRIRKLTPRECFRLMGVSDSDVDKIRDAGISESQQYKMAGNSIVVQVLEGIFTQMFRKDSDVLF